MNFKFVGVKPIIKIKKKRVVKSKIVTAVVGVDDNDNIVANVELNNNYEIEDILAIPFTAKSLSLVGKEVIYSKHKVDNRYTRIYRDKFKATVFPGNEEEYLPFRIGDSVTGRIIEINGIKEFDVS